MRILGTNYHKLGPKPQDHLALITALLGFLQ
jgi:hypothetical protein